MSDGQEFNLHIPFWIDTEGYSDRDRAMFVAGYEFAIVLSEIENGNGCRRPIHRENESRFRMLCGRLGKSCTITPHVGYEGCETWSDLEVAPEEPE